MTAASIQDRYGTESEENSDKKVVNTLWKYSPSAFQNEFVVMLPYCEYAPYSQAAATIGALQQFKINSIYDPDLTGIGGQPLGRDTWSGIYNYYKVLETHIKYTVIEVTNNATGTTGSAGYPSLHGWMCDLTANPPSSSQIWLNATNAASANKQQKFGPVLTYDVQSGRGQQPLHFEYHWDASQFDTSIIDNTKNEWTAVGSDPANLNYFSIMTFNPSGIARTTVVKYEIQFLVAFKQINRTLMNTVN